MKTASCWGVYFWSSYGPEPTTLASGCNADEGNTLWSTMAPAAVVSTYGHVASAAFNVNVTVLPTADTLFIGASRLEGPFGLAILSTRWKLKTTSWPVTASPFEKNW